MAETVALAFSGGLDTSWCVPWLRERGHEVITVTVDVGGLSATERAVLEARSLELGARQHVLVDAREKFFESILRFLIMGNVLRGELYPLCVGAERSLQAAEVAAAARKLGAGAIAHGCTAAGNDQIRFEVALRATAPELDMLAPIRDLAPSREQETAFLRERGFEVPEKTTTYSVNAGLWGVTIGGRETGGTSETIPEEAWVRTRGAFTVPREPERHVLGFQAGVPTSLDGEALDPVALIERLDGLAASFGIGRGIHLGETILGVKGRVAFEAPAASVLVSAHRELEKLVLTGRQQRLKDGVSRTYGDLVHEGLFLEPTCRDIEALLLSSQHRVTGVVHLLLRPGSLFVEGVEAPASLRQASRAVYGEAVGEWTPEDARGFARIHALPVVLHVRAGEACS
jgi:argininosuccinate synthase